ncbi:MAG: hypothetical protein IJ209_07075 [Bacteroidaceae bacterium]|nr:hypothetical protein [Bacteroidaceae bacterium]
MNLLGIIFLQVVAMLRPQAIASTDNGIIAAVESGPYETVVLPRKVRPLSRFEQKMLQELKLQNN